MPYVESSVDVFIANGTANSLNYDLSELTVYTNSQGPTAAYDTRDILVSLSQVSEAPVATYDTRDILVSLSQGSGDPAVAYDTRDILVSLSQAATQPAYDQSSLTVSLTANIPTLAFDTKYLTVGLADKTIPSESVENSLVVFLNSPDTSSGFDESSITVFQTPPPPPINYTERDLTVYLATKETLLNFEEKNLTVFLSPTEESKEFDQRDLTVFLSTSQPTQVFDERGLTVYLSSGESSQTFDQKSLTVYLPSDYQDLPSDVSSLTVFLSGTQTGNSVESKTTVFITGEAPSGFVESSIDVVKNEYVQRYITATWQYPESGPKPLGFDVVLVKKDQYGNFNFNDSSSYMFPMQSRTANKEKSVVFSLFFLDNSPQIPFKTAVRAVYAYGKSPWVSSPMGILFQSDNPLIEVNPVNAAFLSGSTATISVSAIGNGTLSYEWNRVGVGPIANSNYPSYTTNVAGTYFCKVTNTVNGNSYHANSNPADVVLNSPPQITQQPTDKVLLYSGDNAVVDIVATGNGMLSYQWYFNGAKVNGYTQPSFYTGTNGSYYCIVKNTIYGTTTETQSNTITVSGGSQTGGGGGGGGGGTGDGDIDIDKDGGIDIIFLI